MDLKSEKVRWKDQKGAGNLMKYTSADYSDAPEAPVRIVGKHLSGLRDALRQHICGEAALELHSDDSP